MNNPLPHLSEATQAAARIINIGRDLAVLNAELKAAHQIKRAFWIAATVCFTLLFLFFPTLWLTIELHERGFSGLTLAALTASLFAFLTLVCGLFTRRAFLKNHTRSPS